MELQDFIAENSGIKLHRRRVLTAFSHVPDSPLIDMLFNLTRPALRAKKVMKVAHPETNAKPTPTIVRKGMVNYRREFYGLNDVPE